MRWTAAVLFAALLAPTVAARGAETETLTLSRKALRKKDGTFMFTFAPPLEREARDMKTATLSTQVGVEAAAVLPPKSKGLKVDKWGLVAKFKAPRRTRPRVTQFVLRASGGTLVAKIAAPKRDLAALSTFELSFGGHVYRYVYAAPTFPTPDPGTPGGPGPSTTPAPTVPDGPVAFTTIYRAGASTMGTPPSNTVLRSSTEFANFTASYGFSSGTPAVIPNVDFTNNMVVVLAGDAVGPNMRPWKVVPQSVTSQNGAFTVHYHKLWGPICCATSEGSSPQPGPPWDSYVELLTVPRTTGAVSFTFASVKSQYPWY